MSSEVPQIIKMEGETMIVTVSDATSEAALQELNLDNAKEVLEDLSLTSVQFRDYLVIKTHVRSRHKMGMVEYAKDYVNKK